MATSDPQWSAADLVRAALWEDLHEVGDLTAKYFVPDSDTSQGRIVAKQPGVLAGVEIAKATFAAVDPGLQIDIIRPDGSDLAIGDTALEIHGSTQSILTAERPALNFLQRLSGIATLAREFVKAVDGYDVRILDTRKTTPGWRELEKAAVKAGGASNHRMGLYDQVMVKDNHLLAEDHRDSLQEAISRIQSDHPGVKIELEADTLEQVKGFLELDGVDIVLLDNMSLDQLKEAVEMNEGRVELEASGGVNIDTVRSIASTGVDSISVGAITHSAKALDLSLTLGAGM